MVQGRDLVMDSESHLREAEFLTFDIEKMTFPGRGLGFSDGKAVFVDGAVPGDRVQVRMLREKKNWSEGELLRVLKPSPLRGLSPCPYTARCGGCQWDQIALEKQLEWKTTFVRDGFDKFAGCPLPGDFRVLPSPDLWGYRNRILLRGQIRADGTVEAGFLQKASRNRIPVQTCQIACEPVNRVLEGLNQLRLTSEKHGTFRVELQHFPEQEKTGRGSVSALVHPVQDARGFQATELTQKLRELRGVFFAGLWPASGRCAPIFEFERDLGLSFFSSPGSFFQVNLRQNHVLRRAVLQAVSEHLSEYPEKEANILDLFCGSGNLSLPLAKFAGTITGVEGNPHAVKVARHSAGFNHISNAEFIAMDCARYLKDCVRSGRRFDLIIADPPRAGMKALIPDLKKTAPDYLIYISCDPNTLARDFGVLKDDYQLLQLQSLDFFPHTCHVESFAVLKKI